MSTQMEFYTPRYEIYEILCLQCEVNVGSGPTLFVVSHRSRVQNIENCGYEMTRKGTPLKTSFYSIFPK